MGDKVPPRFLTKPVIQQDGTSIVFTTEIEASPQPDVVWFRGSELLPRDQRLVTKIDAVPGSIKYVLTLTIKEVSQADSATYKVEAKNAFGQMSANINLNLTPPAAAKGSAPSFLQKPVIKQVDGGKKILFECKIAADPKPTLTWFRDDVEVKEGGRYKYICQEETKATYYIALELSNPQAADGATYKLNAKNTVGESNANLKLNFDSSQTAGSAPKFTAKPAIRQVAGGVLFEVRLVADPSPVITWYHGDKVVKDGGRYQIITQTDGPNYILILQISNISAADGGTYKVTAKNKLGESNANINLNLEAKKPEGKAPRFLSKPSIAQKDGKIVMTCSVESSPQPKVTWFKGTKEVKAGGRIKLFIEKASAADSYSLICEISSPSGDDGGSYKCTAQNDFGTSNANLSLNIGAPPPKGQGPSFVDKPTIRQGANSVIFECRCKADPKPTVTWYMGTTVVKSGGRYKITTKQEGEMWILIFEILNITMKDGGSYKVHAKNEHGEGNANISLNLEGMLKKAAAPSMKGEPKMTVRKNRTQIFIEMRVISTVIPNIIWMYGGKVIKMGGRYSMDIRQDGDGWIIAYQINEVTTKDAGEYKCTIQNEGGEFYKLISVAADELKDKEAKKKKVPTATLR